MSPTPAYINLANEIFSYLDRGNTGILVPETLSQFLDDMGYAPKDNYWKNGSMANLTVTNPSLQVLAERDHALNLIFSAFSVEHHLLPRPSAGLTPTMPAVTRKGFIDLTSMEILTEPTPQWGYFVQLLRRYNLPSYQRWGELPRSVLPPIPQQAMVDRIANAVAAFTQKANAEKAQVTQAQKELADLRQAQVNTMMGAQIAHQATLESIRQRAFMTTLNSINFQP
ncbi:hypothetical protein H0H93_009547 [Arthromyces matolae]|nr:hypothetical protein H0H93_009547 [Arthromyces matolae]